MINKHNVIPSRVNRSESNLSVEKIKMLTKWYKTCIKRDVMNLKIVNLHLKCPFTVFNRRFNIKEFLFCSVLISVINFCLALNAVADCTGNGTTNVVCDTNVPNPFTTQIVTTNGAAMVDVQTGSMIDTSATGGTAIFTLNGNDTLDINGDVTGGSAGAPGNDGGNTGGGADVVNVTGAAVTGVDDGIITGNGPDNITINPGSMISAGDDGIRTGNQSDTLTVNGGSVNAGTTGNGNDAVIMGGGNVMDTVIVNGGSVTGGNGNNSEAIITGGGNDDVTINDGMVTGGTGNNSEAINTGNQNDNVTVNGGTIQGGGGANSDGIVTGGGSDMVGVNDGMVNANDIAIATAGGSDTVTVTDGSVSGGNIGINTGGFGDTVTVSGGSVDGVNNGITTARGADNISISDANVMGGVNSVHAGRGSDTVTLGDNATTIGNINGGLGNDTLIFTQTVMEPECSDLINNIFPTLNPAGDMVTINGITYQWTNFEVLMPNFICTQPATPFPFRVNVVRGKGCEYVSGPGIDCGFFCSNNFSPGALIDLDAVPEEGYEFVNWTGDNDCFGPSPLKTLRVARNLMCIANCAMKEPEEQNGQIDIYVEGELDSQGNTDEDMEIALLKANKDDNYQNVEIEINFPEGSVVNEATIADEDVLTAKENGDDGCEIISETQVNCFIEEFTDETIILVNLFVPDFGETVQAQVLLTTETVMGELLEEFLNIFVATGGASGNGDGAGGCSMVNNTSDRSGLLIFALIPLAVLIRRLKRRLR